MFEHGITRNSDPREVIHASVWASGAPNPTSHRIRNLSMCGACIDDDGRLEPGVATRVSIGRIDDISAIVTWARDGTAGIRFDHPIDLCAARRRGLRAA